MSIPKVVMSKLYGTSRWETNVTYFLLLKFSCSTQILGLDLLNYFPDLRSIITGLVVARKSRLLIREWVLAVGGCSAGGRRKEGLGACCAA